MTANAKVMAGPLPFPALEQLLNAARALQRDAEVFGLAGATNLPAVRCEVKGLTLGHWYNLSEALESFADSK